MSAAEKYHEMLMPVLNLLLTIILTKNNQSILAAKVPFIVNLHLRVSRNFWLIDTMFLARF